jgi:hypothetical protein
MVKKLKITLHHDHDHATITQMRDTLILAHSSSFPLSRFHSILQLCCYQYFFFLWSLHILLHLESYCGLDEWYWKLCPLRYQRAIQVVTILWPRLGLKWPRMATLSVILALWVESQPLGQNAQLEITDMRSLRGPWRVKPLVPIALVIPLQCHVFINYQPSLFVFSNNNWWCSMSN